MTNPTPQDYALEPVAVVGSGFTLLWIGSGPIAPIIERHGLKVGSLLYAAPQSGWISVDERLPPCDGETMFIGENEAGYVACFNRFTEDGYCFHDSAESEICVMSGLRVWKRVDLPPPPSTKGESTNG